MMLFRTILYALLFYVAYWLFRRFARALFSGSRATRSKDPKRSESRFKGHAVDARFEEIDDDEK